MIEPPKLPLGARLMNAAARPFARSLRRLSLEPEHLLADARTQAKLDDFGDDRFRLCLDRLTASLESEANLTPIGRMIARQEILQSLINRLEINDWHRRHPEIGEERIIAPVIIIGMPRTGTTILHELMAVDPDNRVPMTWEADFPCPPPETATYQTDPRIARSQSLIDQSESLIPDFKKMHRMGAQLPQECVRITGTEFASMAHMITYRVPAYGNWLIHDYQWSPAYRTHRRTLQLLQWRCPAQRWVLKTPAHLWCVADVIREYPDALFIQTHRDPLRVLASVASLGTTLRAMSSWKPDLAEIALEWSDWNAEALAASVDAREKGMIAPERVVDVQFADFMRDSIASVRGMYEKLGLELTDRAERRMRDYLAANQSDKHGRHEYTFADTGLDTGRERAKVARYQEYFGVASESV